MLLKDASDLMLQEKKKGMEREIALHVKIIKAGIASGEFNVKNPEQIAELLVQACAGLRFSVPDHIREDMDLDDEMFELVMEKQKQLLEVFINGIKA
jgi:TetR/AcrR family transcriptional repressor of mexJK operon